MSASAPERTGLGRWLPVRRWPRPRSVSVQIALLVLAAIVAAHGLATLALFALREPWRAETRPGVAANRAAVVARMLDTAEPDQRDALLANAARSLPSLRLKLWDGRDAGTDSDRLQDHPIVERLRVAFGRELAVTGLPAEADAAEEPRHLRLGLRTPADARFQVSLPDDAPGPPHQGAVLVTLLFLATSLTLLSVWAARALTAPLAQLAQAAEAFGTRGEPPPLPENGPEEVLALAGALDRMRARVARLIDERTQMLAAISHDLRTPITRLRLRAEFIEDATVRERTLRDLDQMSALVEAALAYARDERGSSGAAPLVDLTSLVQSVCDAYADTGADVRSEPEPDARTRTVLVRGRPDDLERAVTNLVDNAVKYAGAARLTLHRGTRGVAIEVADDGPGIPDGERKAMLRPFVRGDRARTLDGANGFGLGLSIVRAIAEGHGGSVSLSNRLSGGLSARIELPLPQEDEDRSAGRAEPARRLAAE